MYKDEIPKKVREILTETRIIHYHQPDELFEKLFYAIRNLPEPEPKRQDKHYISHLSFSFVNDRMPDNFMLTVEFDSNRDNRVGFKGYVANEYITTLVEFLESLKAPLAARTALEKEKNDKKE